MTARLSLLVALAVSACGDPVHDDAVAALGPETEGVEKGPDHRPGQPCLTCHGGDGPASLVMSFGGTIYAHQSEAAAAPNAVVRVLGADNRTYETTTNCVGNFWIPARAFEPVYPVKNAVTSGNFSRVMRTEAFRSGSCNECHVGSGAPSSAGRVWVLPDTEPVPSGGCSGFRDGKSGLISECSTPSYTCPDSGAPSYANDVVPILDARCNGCHGNGGQEATGRNLTTLLNVKKQASTAQGLISSCLMPPPPLAPLTPAEKATVLTWFTCGGQDN